MANSKTKSNENKVIKFLKSFSTTFILPFFVAMVTYIVLEFNSILSYTGLIENKTVIDITTLMKSLLGEHLKLFAIVFFIIIFFIIFLFFDFVKTIDEEKTSEKAKYFFKNVLQNTFLSITFSSLLLGIHGTLINNFDKIETSLVILIFINFINLLITYFYIKLFFKKKY